MNNKHIWLTDFCESKHLFVSIIMIQIGVFIYALSSPSFDILVLHQLSILTLLCQFIGLNILILLCKFRLFFNYFDVKIGVFLLMLFIVLTTSILSQVIGYFDIQLSLNLLTVNQSIDFVNLKISLSAVVIFLALVRYFYIQDQWNQQIKKLSDAKLNALQARIKPHFLFNSLNSIASLITIDTQRAEVAISDFSSLMRRTFTHDDKDITLDEELNWVNQYLSIEKLRLDKRLQYHINCEENLLQKKIPVLCLQPLVENAILHGIQPLEDGGVVNINIYRKDKAMCIEVSNPYIENKQKHSNGMAIDNIKERLTLQYGKKAIVQISDTGKQYKINLSIPL